MLVKIAPEQIWNNSRMIHDDHFYFLQTVPLSIITFTEIQTKKLIYQNLKNNVMIFMVDGGCVLQTADVLRASRVSCCTLRPLLYVLACVASHMHCCSTEVQRVSETPHSQYTESEGWKIALSLSLCLSALWQGLHTTTSVLRPQVMMRFSGRRAGRARRRNPRAHSSPFSLLSKMCWPQLKAITSPIQLTSCG